MTDNSSSSDSAGIREYASSFLLYPMLVCHMKYTDFHIQVKHSLFRTVV